MHMIIIFMGTSEFAVASLKKLLDAKYTVSLVVTQPDKAKDRKNKLRFSPVKAFALENGLEVLQPEKIKGNQEVFDRIAGLKPDFIIVAAYGKILPRELLAIPKYGCINVHGSILPNYRGAAPIQWSIINGDEFTGVSIMYMDEGLDTGDILRTDQTQVRGKTFTELHDELAEMGADALIKTLSEIERGTAKRQKQDEPKTPPAYIITRQEGLIDFNKSPAEITRRILGLYPWPGVYTYYLGQSVKVLEAVDLDVPNYEPSGAITRVTKDGIEVASGGGTLLIKKIQFPGKNPMEVKAFLLGNSINEGVILGIGKE